MGKLTTLDLTIFSFRWQLCIIARIGLIPFTVFTKHCFSLLGSFSSSSTPWKMRPNVPVKDKPRVFFIWGKGQGIESQRHCIHGSKCHPTHWPPRLAAQWTEVDRLVLKNALSLNGIRQILAPVSLTEAKTRVSQWSAEDLSSLPTIHKNIQCQKKKKEG